MVSGQLITVMLARYRHTVHFLYMLVGRCNKLSSSGGKVGMNPCRSVEKPVFLGFNILHSNFFAKPFFFERSDQFHETIKNDLVLHFRLFESLPESAYQASCFPTPPYHITILSKLPRSLVCDTK